MKYLLKKFSVSLTGNKQYEENYNKIFRKTLRERINATIERILFSLFVKENGKK